MSSTDLAELGPGGAARAKRPEPSTVHRRAIALLLSLALLACAAAFALSLARAGASTSMRGVRLGDSMADVRGRFQAPGAGRWTSASDPEPSLRWAPDDSSQGLRSAAFEFHQGMLVAARLEVSEGSGEAKGPGLEVGRAQITAREPEAGGLVAVRMISRDCPTHADEVRRLLARAGGDGR